MNPHAEKRTYERHCYSADIAFSYFNQEHFHNAHILNIGMGGMCFETNLSLQPGATLYVRLKETHPDNSCSGFCEGLHIVTLAEVKWCQEVLKSEAFPYGVGVKYFETVY